MTYSEFLDYIRPGMVIRFKEFTLDRHERKKLAFEIAEVLVHDIIPANQPMSKDLMIKYYGDGLEDITYLQLSSMNCTRIVLIVGTNEESQPLYKVIALNQDFYNLGLQEIEVVNEVTTDVPNYVQQMNQWQF